MQSLAIAVFLGVNLGIVVLWLSHVAQVRAEQRREVAERERRAAAERLRQRVEEERRAIRKPAAMQPAVPNTVPVEEFNVILDNTSKARQESRIDALYGVPTQRPSLRAIITAGNNYMPTAPSERRCRVEISPDGGRSWYPTANDSCRESSALDLAAKIRVTQPHIQTRVVEAA